MKGGASAAVSRLTGSKTSKKAGKTSSELVPVIRISLLLSHAQQFTLFLVLWATAAGSVETEEFFDAECQGTGGIAGPLRRAHPSQQREYGASTSFSAMMCARGSVLICLLSGDV